MLSIRSSSMGAEGLGGKPGEMLSAIRDSQMPTDTLKVSPWQCRGPSSEDESNHYNATSLCSFAL